MKRMLRLTSTALFSIMVAGALSSCSSELDDVTAERDELRVQLEGTRKTVDEQAVQLQGMKKTVDQQAVQVELQAAQLEAREKELSRLGQVFAAQVAADQLRIQMIVNGVELVIPSDLLWESGEATATITGEGEKYALEIANALAKTDLFISVVGHTDNLRTTGALADKYPTNWELASARATNAVKFLVANGVDPSRVAAVARGQYDPVASNDTPEGRAANRRIQIILRNI